MSTENITNSSEATTSSRSDVKTTESQAADQNNNLPTTALATENQHEHDTKDIQITQPATLPINLSAETPENTVADTPTNLEASVIVNDTETSSVLQEEEAKLEADAEADADSNSCNWSAEHEKEIHQPRSKKNSQSTLGSISENSEGYADSPKCKLTARQASVTDQVENKGTPLHSGWTLYWRG